MLVLVLGMLLLFSIGMPIAWAMALTSVFYFFFVIDVPLHGMVQRMIGGIDSFALLAIPFFILAGNLMNAGGITDRLIRLSMALVGHFVGGLGQVVVVTNVLTGAMSGSGVASASGTGAVLIPAMRSGGYNPAFAAAVVGASATMGPIIPPSIPLVVYGAVASVSIGRLLVAGAIPGLIMAACLMVTIYFVSRYRNYPSGRRSSFREVAVAVVHALPPLGLPVVMLGGIVAGIMTPTEAAVSGVVYALALGVFVYRTIKPESLVRIVVESAIASAGVVIIISAAQPFGWILAFEQTPLQVVSWISDLGLERWQVLLMLLGAMLVVGCFMEGLAVLVIVTPVLMPLLNHAGIDPMHFGIILTMNIMIGNITPPVGLILYVVASIGKVSLVAVTREIVPFFLSLLVALLLVTFIPSLATWLPDLLIPRQ